MTRTPPEVRFWRKVRKTDTCWVWQGSLNSAGYGLFGLETYPVRLVLAHRYSLRLAREQSGQDPIVPPGMVVMHSCDVRECVNPGHLSVGTVADNNLDMYARGRRDGKHRPATDRRSRRVA